MAAHWFSLRNLYLYLVCFITLLISIFAVVAIVTNVVELIWPDVSAYTPDGTSFRRYAIIDLVRAVVTLLLAGAVYLYHWRKIQGELNSDVVDQG